ncbi:MAG TPA: hypothetical protein VF952_20225 [Chloroflexia bacterium]
MAVVVQTVYQSHYLIRREAVVHIRNFYLVLFGLAVFIALVVISGPQLLELYQKATGTYKEPANTLSTDPRDQILGQPEIYTGIFVILGLGTLIGLLTFLAWGLWKMGLTNRLQALGLPEGSIRALIALFLLLVFVVFSVYLYRQVSLPEWWYRGRLDAAGIAALGDADITVRRIDPPGAGTGADPLYDVWILLAENQSAQQMAQQIITATLTLVTAVSSFYFASRTAEESRDASTGGNTSARVGLSLSQIAPNSGAIGQAVFLLDVQGTGFTQGVVVTLSRAGLPDVVAVKSEVLSPSRIICTFNLTAAATGAYDVVVRNPDGTEVKKPSIFNVT